MRIVSIANFSYGLSGIKPNRQDYNKISYNQPLSCDRFERSNTIAPVTSPSISFQSNVSNGQFLRNLSGIHDPYSGVVILNNKEMNQAYRDLAKLETGKDRIQYLKCYKESMLPVEKTVFQLCESDIYENRYQSLQQILTKRKPRALKSLIKEQKAVFKSIEKETPKLSRENQMHIFSVIDNAKKQILLPHEDKKHFKKTRFVDEIVRISQLKNIQAIETNIKELPEEERIQAHKRLYDAERMFFNNPHDVYVKGKTPLERIQELQAEYAPETLEEPNELKPILDIAKTLPTSKDSVNAYIVEMYQKDDKTIAKRFISESLGTIEHVIPDSKGGENEADNFLFVTKSRNEERSNMPIKEFMKKYPLIPQHCQGYINDMMKAGQSSKLRGHEWYPYVIKETMRKELNTNVNISSYRVSPQKAFKSMPIRLRERYPKFNKYFTNAQ